MATKQVEIEGIGTVSIYKRRGVTSVRLSIAADNKIRVTIPAWAPFKMGVDFARTKQAWIQLKQQPRTTLQDGQQIGKAHRLRFVTTTGARPTSRLRGNEIFVGVPPGMTHADEATQDTARRAAIRALKAEAEMLLPQRIAALAKQYGFAYHSVMIKQMKGRWGSCSHQKDIVFNCFLMQLPWELIDYVVMHELVHTRIMAHGEPFWTEVAKYVPHLTAIRKKMRTYQPVL